MEMERRDFLKLTAGALTWSPQEYQGALGQTTTQVFPLSPGDKLTF